MKVAIIGAGFGGVASAITLAKAGHEVELFEQGETLRLGGNGVILFPNATRLLADLGVSLAGLGSRMDALDLLTKDGTPLMSMRLSRIADRYGSPIVVSERGDVLRRMAELLPAGSVRFASRCTAIEDRPGGGPGVVARFEDGSHTDADLLIGADGHRSVVRTHLFGEDPAGYTGDATWHGVTELPDAFSNGHRIHSLYDEEGICIVHPVGGNKVYWAFELPWSDGDRVPPGSHPGSPVANLRERFGGWTASVMPQLLASITDDDVGVFPHVLHHVRPAWGRGPVTLVGDAVHAVPPRLGMGLAQALEDAWVLGRALTHQGRPADLVRTYERARLPRIRKMYAVASAMGRKTLPLPPRLLRVAGSWLPVTSYQTALIKRLSNYLNDDAP